MTPSDSAIQYAKDVTSKKIVAGKYVKLACKRFLADLKKKIGPIIMSRERPMTL